MIELSNTTNIFIKKHKDQHFQIPIQPAKRQVFTHDPPPFYLFNCSLVKYNNVFVSLETVFLNDLFLFLFIPPNFSKVKYCNF